MSTKAVALPLDVLRDVLEYSARIDKQIAFNLTLVSSLVREWCVLLVLVLTGASGS